MDRTARAAELAFADLFCGAGGLSFGFRMAGFAPAVAVEVDPWAARTYLANHPGVRFIVKDIRKVSAEEVAEAARLAVASRRLDVLIGGVPCEGYSLLNRSYDPLDPRNYLFAEFMRMVRGLRPRAVVIENVPGMKRRRNGEFVSAVSDALADAGYRVSVFELDAVRYGVPQRRVRLFFVGTRDGLFTIPRATHAIGGGSPHPVTVRDAISDLPPVAPGGGATQYTQPPLTAFQASMRDGSERLANHVAPSHPRWTVERIARTPPGGALYSTFAQRIRLAWDTPAPTIPAGGVRPQWFFAHPEQPRGLTVREVARLQGFPDSYVFMGPIVKQRVLVGDAVPPPVARAIAERLRECLL
jgi:DNA (cytosine-5)-methyltransferase 1